jgi:hypothetical protein|tara:strand:+ start:413 stop:727 length:315 start_codon:yes stop_codon:yes gene_type:complete
MEADLEAKWDEFMEVEGFALQKDIYDHLQDTAHLFDLRDGIHAKWSPDGVLGLLLIFHEEEAEFLLSAFQAALEGVDEAGEAFAVWTASFMGLLKMSLTNNWEE